MRIEDIDLLTVGMLKGFLKGCNVPDDAIVGVYLTNGDFAMITKVVAEPPNHNLMFEVNNIWEE